MENRFAKEIDFSADLFVGREREEYGVLGRLAHPRNRGSSAISGDTGIGKSWFLAHLQEPELLAEWELAAPGVTFISLNCSEISPWSPDRFWQPILQSLQANDIPASEQELVEQLLNTAPADSRLIGQLLDQIVDNDRFLVLVLDDFEWIIDHVDPKDPSFLNEMRSFLVREKKGLGIVLATTTPLNHLLTDSDRFDFVVSPFDNVFYPVPLPPFDEKEARHFIEVRLKDSDIAFTEEETKRLLERSGGHPDRLRKACYQLFADKTGKKA